MPIFSPYDPTKVLKTGDTMTGPLTTVGPFTDNTNDTHTIGTIVNGSQTSSTPTIRSGIVAYYTFDATSGTSVADAAGTNTGTWTGTLGTQWTITGKVNGAGSFNGTDNYVSIPNAAALQIASAFSISCWVYSKSIGNYYFFLTKTTGNGIAGSTFELRSAPTTGQIQFLGKTGSINGSTNLTINTWQHIVATWDGTTGNLYLNGINIGSSTSMTFTNVTDIMEIGTRGDGYTYFNGLIDEAGVWNRALTSAEVTDLFSAGNNAIQYNFGSVIPQASDLAQWKDGTGTLISRIDGGGNLTARSISSSAGDMWLTGNIYNSGTGMTLRQNGDTYGFSQLQIQNRVGANGAIFSTALDVVDFGFLPAVSGIQSNFRLERRGLYVQGTGNSVKGEFQFVLDSLATAKLVAGIGLGTFWIDSTLKVGIGTASPAEALTVVGNVSLSTAGNKLKIATGSNASAGTGTLTGGTVTINTTAVTANSLIFLTDTSSSVTNVGTLTVSSKTAGVSFTVTSTIALDASTFNWLIIN